MYALALQAERDAVPAWQQVLQDIPHDTGAVIVYLLIGGFAFMIWYGSRPKVIKRSGARPAGGEQSIETTPGTGAPPSSAARAEAGGRDHPKHTGD